MDGKVPRSKAAVCEGRVKEFKRLQMYTAHYTLERLKGSQGRRLVGSRERFILILFENPAWETPMNAILLNYQREHSVTDLQANMPIQVRCISARNEGCSHTGANIIGSLYFAPHPTKHC